MKHITINEKEAAALWRSAEVMMQNQRLEVVRDLEKLEETLREEAKQFLTDANRKKYLERAKLISRAIWAIPIDIPKGEI